MTLTSVTSGEGGVLSGRPALHQVLSLFFVQSTVIVGICRLLSLLGHSLGQPDVIFEIIGGILLGPSAMGRQTRYLAKIFPVKSQIYISLVANIGLVFYLFIVGMEMDPKLLLSHARKAGAVAIVGMGVPFGLGVAISYKLFDVLQANDPLFKNGNFVGFYVFIGTAMSITAFPVLARILKEGGLIYTRPGALAMGAAAINDAIAWCLLILAISIANAGDMRVAGYVFGCTALIALGIFIIIGPIFHFIVEKAEKFESKAVDKNLFAFTLILLFLFSWTTALIGVHFIFGAFLFGLIVPRNSRLFHECNDKIEPLVLTYFLPLYFALSGLQTDITNITTNEQGAMIVLVCVVATVGKFIGCGLTALVGGLPVRESCAVAVLMNTRGLIELIVLNLGLTSQILNQKTFSVMVIMCLFTTFLTVPLINVIYPERLRVIAREVHQTKEIEEDDELVMAQALNRDAVKISTELNMLVVVDHLPQMQLLMNVLTVLAPVAEGSSLSVTTVKFDRPTLTESDEFLGLAEGRLILRHEEATTLTSFDEHAATKAPARLLPISMLCKALGAEVVAYSIKGDPTEFPAEVRSLCVSSGCDLALLPWTGDAYFERLLWRSLRVTVVPIAIIAATQQPQANPTGGETASFVPTRRLSSSSTGDHQALTFSDLTELKAITSFVAVITGRATDTHVLALAMRVATQGGGRVSVTVLVPHDRKSFDQDVQFGLAAVKKLAAANNSNLKLVIMPCASTNIVAIVTEVNGYEGDVLAASFVPLATTLIGIDGDESESAAEAPQVPTPTRARSTSVSAAIAQSMFAATAEFDVEAAEEVVAAHLETPEFGVLSSRFLSSERYRHLVVVHESSVYARARRSTLQSGKNEDNESQEEGSHNQTGMQLLSHDSWSDSASPGVSPEQSVDSPAPDSAAPSLVAD